MYLFKVNGETYKVRFSYAVLCQTDLIERLFDSAGADDPVTILKSTISLTGELLLAGLQREHEDEFGYLSEDEFGNFVEDAAKKKTMLRKVYYLIDDYESESFEDPETGETQHDAVSLFNDLQSELEKNGFLSRITKIAQQTAEQVDATVIPMDHQTPKRKRKATEKES